MLTIYNPYIVRVRLEKLTFDFEGWPSVDVMAQRLTDNSGDARYFWGAQHGKHGKTMGKLWETMGNDGKRWETMDFNNELFVKSMEKVGEIENLNILKRQE